jgi:hypothetical protein
MKEAKDYLKIVDDDRTLDSIEAAIKLAQSDIDVKGAIFDFCSWFDDSLDDSWIGDLDDWFENKYNKPEIEETIPVTLGIIRNKCGWNEYCDVTGSNHYMLKEFTVSDREIFDVKVSHAKLLNLI